MTETKALTSDITIRDLKRIRDLSLQIRRDKDQLEELRYLAAGLGSKPTDAVKVQTSPAQSGNRFAEAAADLAELLREEETELDALQVKALRYIGSVDNSLGVRVLRYRYIDCQTWKSISVLTGYTVRHLIRFHDDLVAELPEE